MTFNPLFGPSTKLSLSFVTFRVSRFPVSHLTHETVKLGLQNTLNMSKTTRVYFGVLHTVHKLGMKYCKRKIPLLRMFWLKVVISFPVIRENQEELDNEMWSVERSSYTTIALDRF